jgi:hypothetical protein
VRGGGARARLGARGGRPDGVDGVDGVDGGDDGFFHGTFRFFAFSPFSHAYWRLCTGTLRASFVFGRAMTCHALVARVCGVRVAENTFFRHHGIRVAHRGSTPLDSRAASDRASSYSGRHHGVHPRAVRRGLYGRARVPARARARLVRRAQNADGAPGGLGVARSRRARARRRAPATPATPRRRPRRRRARVRRRTTPRTRRRRRR